MGPMMDAKFAERYEEFLGWVQPHHAVQAAYGRITKDNPRDGFVVTRAAGCTTTRWSLMAYAPVTGSLWRRRSGRSSA